VKRETLYTIGGLLILMALFTTKTISKTKQRVVDNFGLFVTQASERFKVPQERIYAHICVESDGNAGAVGSAGERGLMQLKPGALTDSNKVSKANYSFDDMFDAEKNITAGTAYLAWIERYFFPGDWDKVSRAYNQGVGRPNSPLAYTYLAKIKLAEYV
jgi:soluble lytic murein transglycosylase-like protein